MVYITQLAVLIPPVWLPPTMGAITGGVNNGLLAGQTPETGVGHLVNCENFETISTKFERCAGTSVTVKSTTKRPCNWS